MRSDSVEMQIVLRKATNVVRHAVLMFIQEYVSFVRFED